MIRRLRHLSKYIGINALAKRAYAFYVEPWLTQVPLHTLRMLSDLEEFWAIKPLLSETPGKGPVLVFAPHQDDEIIGAGGSLIKHVVKDDQPSITHCRIGASFTPIAGSRELELQSLPQVADVVHRVVSCF